MTDPRDELISRLCEAAKYARGVLEWEAEFRGNDWRLAQQRLSEALTAAEQFVKTDGGHKACGNCGTQFFPFCPQCYCIHSWGGILQKYTQEDIDAIEAKSKEPQALLPPIIPDPAPTKAVDIEVGQYAVRAGPNFAPTKAVEAMKRKASCPYAHNEGSHDAYQRGLREGEERALKTQIENAITYRHGVKIGRAEERAAIVATMREWAGYEGMDNLSPTNARQTYLRLAEAIERGEHIGKDAKAVSGDKVKP
jgi:hypothetical protein